MTAIDVGSTRYAELPDCYFYLYYTIVLNEYIHIAMRYFYWCLSILRINATDDDAIILTKLMYKDGVFWDLNLKKK